MFGLNTTIDSVADLPKFGPWDADTLDFEWQDNWLLGYIDILTLFITLLVVLLVIESRQQDEMEPLPPAMPVFSVLGTELPNLVPQSQINLPSAKSPADVESKEMIPTIPTAMPKKAESVNLFALTPDLPESVFGMAVPSSLMLAVAVEEQPVMAPQIAPAAIVDAPPQVIDPIFQQLVDGGLDHRLKAKRVPRGIQLEFQENILFSLASAELKQAGYALLKDLLPILLAQDGVVIIEGHTDNQAISSALYPSNWELSSKRATQVARYLIEGGYDPTQLQVVGYADTRPLVSNETAEGRANNRRVALIIERQ